MKPLILAGLLTLAFYAPSVAQEADDVGPKRVTWNFHDGRSGEPPDDWRFWRAGSAPDGRWRVRSEKGAPSGSKVLSQEELAGPSDRWVFACPKEPSFGDVTADVSFKVVGGASSRACGLVWRFKDERNHYALEADATAGAVTLYAMKDGRRTKVAAKECEIASGVWHELRIDCRKKSFEAILDNRALFEADDGGIGGWGSVGVFTRGDAACRFDDLIGDPLAP
ncbi:MAG: hypothetical protein HY303_18070 [Candidatus Wallbacteria bacterium]|nr:hypothetical protein [Candidatus Wallbacteria bacterium]